MKRNLLLGYQLLSGFSDALTGALLIFAPAFTLHLMRVHVTASETLTFVSYIGVFVLSTGIACLYGAALCRPAVQTAKLETVWLLTGITRGLVCLFVGGAMARGSLETAWVSVAVTDGLFAAVQLTGLARGWLPRANA